MRDFSKMMYKNENVLDFLMNKKNKIKRFTHFSATVLAFNKAAV